MTVDTADSRTRCEYTDGILCVAIQTTSELMCLNMSGHPYEQLVRSDMVLQPLFRRGSSSDGGSVVSPSSPLLPEVVSFRSISHMRFCRATLSCSKVALCMSHTQRIQRVRGS